MKHVYKKRKETTHVKVGERRHTSKISIMYVNMVTRLVYTRRR